MTTLEEQLRDLYRAKELTIATAESSTAGLLASRITAVGGSSAYFIGGLVSYAYEAKESLLGVPHDMLLAHGAVSEEVAMAMARGARARLETDVAVSITGIAGPGGGLPQKPVGLHWVGLADADHVEARSFVFDGDRTHNRDCAAEEALRMLIEWAEAH